MLRPLLTGRVILSSATPQANLFLIKSVLLIRRCLPRYDNCFANSTTLMVDYYGDEWISPTRFEVMANAVAAVDRPMEYYVCQWGVGTDVGQW